MFNGLLADFESNEICLNRHCLFHDKIIQIIVIQNYYLWALQVVHFLVMPINDYFAFLRLF